MAKKPTKTTKTTKAAYHPGGNVPPRRPQVRPPVGTPKRRPPKGPQTVRGKPMPQPVLGTPTPKRPPQQGVNRTGPLTPNQKRLRRLNNKANRVQGRIARPKKTSGVLPGGPGVIGSGPNTQKRLSPQALRAKRLQAQKMRDNAANKANLSAARRTPRRPIRGLRSILTGITPRPGRPTPTPPKRPVSTRRRSTNPSRTMTRAEAKKRIQQFSQNRPRQKPRQKPRQMQGADEHYSRLPPRRNPRSNRGGDN